jgi:GNAT superfamily N-acetyltransferase
MEHSVANGFSVRLATQADRPHILTAVQLLMPGVEVERRHRWLYEDNPHGRALTWLATDDATGEVAGVTSLFMRRIVAGGRDVLGALGGDGFVHPKFRRRGIATAMHGVARDAMRDRGIEVMFGTPHEGNVTPLAQHQTRDVFEIVRYTRPVGCGAFGLPRRLDRLARALLRPRRGRLSLERLQARDRRVDELWERTRPELAIAAVRDARFYDWRFRCSPRHDEQPEPMIVLDGGRPIAACALERAERRLRVYDLLAPYDAWSRAVAAILAHADDCDAVDFKLSRETARARGLWRYGFTPREGKVLNVMIPEDSPHRASYFDASRWFFTCV